MIGVKGMRVLRETPPKHCTDLYRVEIEYRNVYVFEDGKWALYNSPVRAINVTEHVMIVERKDIKKDAVSIGAAMQTVFCANALILRTYPVTSAEVVIN